MSVRKKKTIIIGTVLLVMVIGVGVKIFTTTNYAPTKEEQEALSYMAGWKMGYDKKHHLVREELIFPKGNAPSQGIYYKYDAEGNRIERIIKDNAYDLANSTITYEYENKKMVEKTDSGTKYEISYKEDCILASVKDAKSSSDYNYCYELSKNGNVTSIIQFNPNQQEEEFVYCCCEYNWMGKVNSLTYCYDSAMPEMQDVYTYKYDLLGRYSEINYQSYLLENESITAEFVYEQLSDDYTVYTYDDKGVLIGKYIYKHDEDGHLTEVSMYRGETPLGWGITTTKVEYNYPGGEVPYNFLELP